MIAQYISVFLGIAYLVAAFPAVPEFSRIPIERSRGLRPRDSRNSTLATTPHASGGFYTCPVTIGEGANAKTFRLNFDTGSADLWVFSTLLPASDQAMHTIYNPKQSNTSVPLNLPWSITYLDGTFASGVAFKDTINLGGLVLKQSAVEAADNVSANAVSDEADGLLGLSLNPNTIGTPNSVPTTLESIISHPLAANVFTCALTRTSEPNGFYTFGFIDPVLTTGKQILYTDVLLTGQAPGSWEFTSTFITINGQTIQRPGNTAIADTGTSIIIIADQLLPSIYGPIGGKFDGTNWLVPSNITQSTLPVIGIPAGPNVVTLRAADLLNEPSPDPNWFIGAIQGRGDTPIDIFGDVWLRNIYAIHDIGMTGPGKVRFGFVPRPYGVI